MIALRGVFLATVVTCVGALTTGCGKPCYDYALYVINADGSDRHRIRVPHGLKPINVHWLAGGHRIAVTGWKQYEDDTCWSLKPDGSDRRQEPMSACPDGHDPPLDPVEAWSPDEHERVISRYVKAEDVDAVFIERFSDRKIIRRLDLTYPLELAWGPGKQIVYVKDIGSHDCPS